MYLEKLSVVNYKNLSHIDLAFSKKINCFLGDNGMGKTNLLDTIYYLSFCKSFSNTRDKQNLKYNEPFFVLQAEYQRLDETEKIYCGYKKDQKKRFQRNKKEYSKLSDHIGLLPLVIISPIDQNLILGGSEDRRKFVDGVISQFDRRYLENLIKYNKALKQRNALLKQHNTSEILDLYTDQLIVLGNSIFRKRTEFISQFISTFQYFYSTISQENEQVTLEYKSSLNKGDFENQLKGSLEKDLILGYTSVGIHKDDLDFLLSEYPIKRSGSQGQNKTFVVALKLAQFEFIKNLNTSVNPILLLDDIFDKLDSNRVEQIVKLVGSDRFGQIFITDTNREHIDQIVERNHMDAKIFLIDKGKLNSTTQK